MSLSTYTVVHVVLSLVGITSGVVVLLRPSASPKAWGLTTLFLVTTLAASVTGLLYLLPFPRFGMGHGIAIASLTVFVPTLLALYRHRLAGPWRTIYVTGAATLLYLNAFIAVVQVFSKSGYLRSLPATTPLSPPLLAHFLLLFVCLWLTLHAINALHPDNARTNGRRVKHLYVVDRWG
ncbi:MAG: hypothetical protein K2X72_25655 [Reyranella sp.]|nr:hypothetical protein [Reyranella sp.]